jgi:hypothetical protein
MTSPVKPRVGTGHLRVNDRGLDGGCARTGDTCTDDCTLLHQRPAPPTVNVMQLTPLTAGITTASRLHHWCSLVAALGLAGCST